MDENRTVKLNSDKPEKYDENQEFEALCSEIDLSGALLRVTDAKIRALLNDYYSSVIYPRFAFIAQTNVKKDAGACLAALKRFKAVVTLCSRVESFVMPANAPAYLAGDFKAKADYFDALAGGRGITDGSGLEEFEAVVKALAALYEEKRRHESEKAAAGAENKKSGVRGVESAVAGPVTADGKTKRRPAVNGKKSVKKKKRDKAADGSAGASPEIEKAPESVKSESPGAQNASWQAKKRRPASVTPVFASVSVGELVFVFACGGLFAIRGAIVMGDANKVSLLGAVVFGAYGTILASFVANLFKLRIRLLVRDFFLAVAAFSIINAFWGNHLRAQTDIYSKNPQNKLNRQVTAAPSTAKNPPLVENGKNEYPQAPKEKNATGAGRHDSLKRPLIPIDEY